MAEKKTELVVSLVGMVETIIVVLVKFIKESGGDVGACICHLASAKGEGTLHKIAELMVAKARADTEIVSKYLESSWDAIVDCGQDLAQMISAGEYDSVNSDITAEHFPLVKGSAKLAVKVDLLHFNCYFNNSDEIIAKLKAVNEWLAEQGAGYRYRFARIEELLALGAARRDLQRKYPIGALGSIWREAVGRRRFACFSRNGRFRDLALVYLEDVFHDAWRFAVVREQSS